MLEKLIFVVKERFGFSHYSVEVEPVERFGCFLRDPRIFQHFITTQSQHNGFLTVYGKINNERRVDSTDLGLKVSMSFSKVQCLPKFGDFGSETSISHS